MTETVPSLYTGKFFREVNEVARVLHSWLLRRHPRSSLEYTQLARLYAASQLECIAHTDVKLTDADPVLYVCQPVCCAMTSVEQSEADVDE